MLVMLTLAFYRLFEGVNRQLAVMVVIFGGVMPALIYFVNSVSDAAALTIVKEPNVLSGFDKPQRDALAGLFLGETELAASALLDARCAGIIRRTGLL